MSWNDTLAGWADELAHKCYYHHSNDEGDGEYGQNIGAGFSAEDVDIMITDRMYNEQLIHYPGYASEPAENGYDWMHFTQIVWKGSLSVGCATLVCDHLENIADDIPPSFTVCNYYPPGESTTPGIVTSVDKVKETLSVLSHRTSFLLLGRWRRYTSNKYSVM